MKEAIEAGYGLFITGDNDVGKTSIAAIMAKEARRLGNSCMFIAAYDYLLNRDKIFNDSMTIDDRVRSVKFLVLDDLGKESAKYGISHGDSSTASVSVSRIFEALLRCRNGNMLSTIVTSNLSMENILKRYGRSFSKLITEKMTILGVDAPSQRDIERKKMVRFFHS